MKAMDTARDPIGTAPSHEERSRGATTAPVRPRTDFARAARIVLAIGVIGFAAWAGWHREKIDPEALANTVRDLGAWGPAAFIAFYAIATVIFVPATIFALAGGVLFGPVAGTVVNLIGATLGATLAFLTARHLVSDWVCRKAGPRVTRLMDGVAAQGSRFVAFVRLVPLFPFNLLNYALGLTRISTAQYIAASLICMIPGTLAFTWLGHAGRQALAGDATAVRYGLIGLGVLATIAFVPRVWRLRGGGAPHWIEAEELRAWRRDSATDLVIIDVRDRDEFSGALGHIEGALNLPVAELPEQLTKLEWVRDRPVVVVCHTEKRSAKAAGLLRDAGFTHVRVLRGGMVRWTELPNEP